MLLKPDEGKALVSWYRENKRDLPWRDTGNAYHVWVSEIMLQQTRIEAVREKYIRFIEELPDIRSLAAVPDDRLMKLWEGLGYYSRARSLKKCAQTLVNEYDARLPADHEALKKLPGIGPYTAGAIASIAFDLPHPAVDGNVLRVLARFTGLRDDIRDPAVRKTFEAQLQEYMTAAGVKPSDFTQALMELGETLCGVRSAACGDCPLKGRCTAFREGLTKEIPYRSKLKERKIAERTLLVIRDHERFVIRKRADSGLLAGLYEFIGTDGSLGPKEALLETEKLGFQAMKITRLPDSKHIFSHLEWHMKAYEVLCGEITEIHEPYLALKKKELQDTAFPSAFQTYLKWYSVR